MCIIYVYTFNYLLAPITARAFIDITYVGMFYESGLSYQIFTVFILIIAILNVILDFQYKIELIDEKMPLRED